MKSSVLCLLAICASSSFAAENIEPSLGYTLIVNGTERRIKPEETIQLQGTFADPSIKLVADKERIFSYTGFSFRYPAYFSFEADIESENYKNWTLSGNDFKIMIFKVKSEFTPEAFVNGMKKKFGNNAKVSDVKRVFGGKQYKGKRVDITVAETSFFQEGFLVASKDDHVMLVLQDSPPSEKVSEKESKWALDLLKQQFEYKN